jgi:hypothetical protein
MRQFWGGALTPGFSMSNVLSVDHASVAATATTTTMPQTIPRSLLSLPYAPVTGALRRASRSVVLVQISTSWGSGVMIGTPPRCFIFRLFIFLPCQTFRLTVIITFTVCVIYMALFEYKNQVIFIMTSLSY